MAYYIRSDTKCSYVLYSIACVHNHTHHNHTLAKKKKFTKTEGEREIEREKHCQTHIISVRIESHVSNDVSRLWQVFKMKFMIFYIIICECESRRTKNCNTLFFIYNCIIEEPLIIIVATTSNSNSSSSCDNDDGDSVLCSNSNVNNDSNNCVQNAAKHLQ